MRSILSAVALILASGPALAGPEDFFFGRPPSVGVVGGGAFGVGGFDYVGEMESRRPAARHPSPTARHLAHAGRVHHGDGVPVVARPYYRP